MRRDKDGAVKLSLWQKFKSVRLGKKLRKGQLPKGRVTPKEARDAFRIGACANTMEVFGMLSAKVFRADGSCFDAGLISVEKITTAFRDYIVDALQDSTTYPMDAFTWHGSGTGATAEANTQTALVTEVATRTDGTQIEGATADIYKSVGTVSYSGSFAIVEHGIFTASTAGTMMDRSLFSAINVSSGDSIQFTYEATFNAEA